MTSAPEAGPYDCPACGQPVWPADNFCEACRAELAPVRFSGAVTDQAGSPSRPSCPACQDAPVTPEGYCESCGRKVPSGADHAEIELSGGLVAGVTDRGLRHRRNEDAMALATAQIAQGPPPAGAVVVAVVCDGVSSSSRPDEASKAAAQAAAPVLLAAARAGGDLTAASARAFDAAKQALLAMAEQNGSTENAPAATFVAAVVTGQDVTVSWIGDSRAYWLDAPDGAAARQLTSDDSVAQQLVAEGLLTISQALASPAGHVVTGWIGADLSDAMPHVATFTPPGPGLVLLCTDGLWNYEPSAAGLAARALPGGLTDPLGAARSLVAFAVDAGGSDNITTVLVPFPPRGGGAAAGRQADRGEPAGEPA